MKLTQKTKYASAALLFVFATTALSFVNVQFASAASLQWTGGGDGTTFADTANWSTGAVPQNGDNVTFDITGLTEQKVLNNDISGLSLAGITFTGNAANYYAYTLQGNALTLSGNVQNTITGANADYVTPSIQNNLTLAGPVTVSKVNIGTTGTTLNLQANQLTFSGAAGCGTSLTSNLSGSGMLNITGAKINVSGANASYTGPINVTGSASIGADSFGTSAQGTTVSGAGTLAVVHTTNKTSAEPFTLGGTGWIGATQNYISGCAGGSGPASTLTLTGGVTLTSNFLYNGENNLKINAPYTANGHTFTVKSGAEGTLTTPQGEAEAPKETIELNGDSSTFVTVGNNQTAILNGTRDLIGVGSGGVLKGTGTANGVYINDGAVIAPGNSPGTLTVLDNFTLTGTYEAELLNKSTYDKLAIGENYTGSSNAVFLNSGASLNVVLFDGWTIKKGDTFTIIDNLSDTDVEGTFEGLAEGGQLTVDGITFSISYVGGDGNDVVLTALNTGDDPSAPNTGVLQVVRKNPLVVAGFGIVTAALLITLAVRRRQTNK
jgi:hypothetical protein